MKLILAFVFGLFTSVYAAVSADGSGAKAKIESAGKRAIATLTKRDVGPGTRRKEFIQQLEGAFDVHAISKFVIGKYWRQWDESQRAQFVTIYKELLELQYSARFMDYEGVQFDVGTVRTEPDGAAIVQSTINMAGKEPLDVDWKLYKKDGTWRIYDIFVAGISMAQAHRDEYQPFLREAGSFDEFIKKRCSNIAERAVCAR